MALQLLVSLMTTEEKEVALAELAGFPADEIEHKREATQKYCRKPYLSDVSDHGGGYFWRDNVTPKFKWLDAPNQLPNSQSLDTLHAIAMAQRGNIQTAMRPFLFGACGQARVHIHTADQFCEALLRAAKKWKDRVETFQLTLSAFHALFAYEVPQVSRFRPGPGPPSNRSVPATGA